LYAIGHEAAREASLAQGADEQWINEQWINPASAGVFESVSSSLNRHDVLLLLLLKVKWK
jgi:hypothetical protein